MKVINAKWEERNTGLKTCEIIFENGDNLQIYFDQKIENDYDFSVVKVPIGYLELVHQLEQINYRYLENQLSLTFDVSQIDNINPKWSRLLRGFNYRELSKEEEINSVLSEVGKGMFETDRFSFDPFWKEDISSVRYQHWIRELFESGKTKFYVIEKGGKEMGFFSIKEESKSINSCPIAGIYNSYRFSGLIFVLTWYWLLISKEKGYNKIMTCISSNNRVMLSSISKAFSFSVRDIYIVLRKTINC